MILAPGGYLAPHLSQFPICATDIAPTNAVYWTPHINLLPWHDGNEIVMTTPGQLRLDLVGAHEKDKIYTVAVVTNPDTGSPMLATSPAWADSGYGTSNPGDDASFFVDANLTPPGPTWLPVNHTERVMRNGSSTYTVPVGQAIWLGTIRPCDDGLVRIDVTEKQDARRDIWNYWNRKPVVVKTTETTATGDEWFYGKRHPQKANNNPLNRVTVMTGQWGDPVQVDYFQAASALNGVLINVAIQRNDETFATGYLPQPYPGQTQPGALKHSGTIALLGRTIAGMPHAHVSASDCRGVNKFSALHWIESFLPGSDPNWQAAEELPGVAAYFAGGRTSLLIEASYLA